MYNGISPRISSASRYVESLVRPYTGQNKGSHFEKVSKVDHIDSAVVVHCAGSDYVGDIVVGADGIHSTVKKLMHQHIEVSSPRATVKDSDSISAEYNCIFGIGNAVKGEVNVGDSHRSYAKGHSTLSFVGRGGKIYWFLFSKWIRGIMVNIYPGTRRLMRKRL